MKKIVLLLLATFAYSFSHGQNKLESKLQNGHSYLLINNMADIELYSANRNSRGRAFVLGNFKELIINYTNDFSGGTHIHGALKVEEHLDTKGLFLRNSTSMNGWMISRLNYHGNTLQIASPDGNPNDCNIDFFPGGIDGKTLKT